MDIKLHRNYEIAKEAVENMIIENDSYITDQLEKWLSNQGGEAGQEYTFLIKSLSNMAFTNIKHREDVLKINTTAISKLLFNINTDFKNHLIELEIGKMEEFQKEIESEKCVNH